MRRRIGVARRVSRPRAISLRAEKEHSRTLRIRNLLLMLLRVLARAGDRAGRRAARGALARGGARADGARDRPRQLAELIGGRRTDARCSISSRRAARDVLGRRDVRRIASGSSPPTAACAADRRRAARRVESPRADRRRRRSRRARSRAPRPSCAPRDSTRSRSRLLTDGQRTEWQQAPSIADVQVVLHVPSVAPPPNRAVTLADRAARALDAARRGRRALPRRATRRRIASRSTGARSRAARRRRTRKSSFAPRRPSAAGCRDASSSSPTSCAGDNVRHFAVWIGPAPGR